MNSIQGFGETKFTIDLQAQRHWNWTVAAYLYGAGTGSGLVFLELLLRGIGMVDEEQALRGISVALVLVLVSLGFLFSHLGPQGRWGFFYGFRRPRVSWTSRGAIIITVLVLLQVLLLLPSVQGFEGMPWNEGTIGGNILRGTTLLLAVAFMAYSGLVLSSWNSIPFWNTPALPVLYVGYSSLCGMAALLLVELIAAWGKGPAIGPALWPYLLALLLGSAFLLLVYVWGMSTSTVPARESVRRLVRGEHCWSFWVGTVGIGLVLPMLVVTLAVSGQLVMDKALESILAATYGAIQVGGFLLRDNILRVGIYGYPV